jgi:hypothetical protein
MTMTWFRTRRPRQRRWRNGRSYAPTAGRLAAAMATISARRRRTLAGAERSNDCRCRMVPISSGADGNRSFREARTIKMGLPQRRVEGAPKIATRLSSDPLQTVVLLPCRNQPQLESSIATRGLSPSSARDGFGAGERAHGTPVP